MKNLCYSTLRNLYWVVVVHAFNSRGDRKVFEFKTSLVYRVTSSTARTTQRNLISKTTTSKKGKLHFHLMGHLHMWSRIGHDIILKDMTVFNSFLGDHH